MTATGCGSKGVLEEAEYDTADSVTASAEEADRGKSETIRKKVGSGPWKKRAEKTIGKNVR